MERHVLSEIDVDSRTALCRRCGPVSICKASKTKYRCSVAKAEHRGRRAKQEPSTRYSYDGGHFYLKQSEKNAYKAGKVCAICGFDGALVIDHCHTTGKIRGAVCTHCNWLLGHAKDNPDTLARAIEYLKA